MLKRILRSAFCLCLLIPNLYSQDCSNRSNFTGYTQSVTDAIMDYTCGAIVDHHADPDVSVVAHGPLFLSWHRDYIQGLEDYLVTQGMSQFVPLAAWNPCTLVPWGSLSTCPEQQPMNQELEDTTIGCGNFDTDRYTCENLCLFDDFEDFQDALQLDHNGIHGAFGASTTFNSSSSPAVVLFWPWHAFVDDIYLKYQAATVAEDLPITLELVEQNCCDVTFRAPKFCCLDGVEWSFGNKKLNSIISTSEDGDYFYMSGNVLSTPSYTVSITYTGTCGNTRTVGLSYLHDSRTPQLPSSPPNHMQRICMEDMRDENCYDFGNFECLESFEVTTSSSKLIAEVNGTELCLYYIHHAPYEGTVTLTPTGTCGEGEPVTWTIYANQEEDCNDFGDGGGWNPRMIEATTKISVFPNPFSDQLNVVCEGLEKEKSYSIELMDMLGRVIHKTNQMEHTFSTSQLTAGLYFLKVSNDKNEVLFTEKYIKQ